MACHPTMLIGGDWQIVLRGRSVPLLGQFQLAGYCEGGHGPPKKGKKRKKRKKKKKEKINILHAVILNVHTMKFCVLELATLDSSNINIYLSDLYNTLGAKNQNGGCS